jgi:hypothetical protein
MSLDPHKMISRGEVKSERRLLTAGLRDLVPDLGRRYEHTSIASLPRPHTKVSVFPIDEEFFI